MRHAALRDALGGEKVTTGAYLETPVYVTNTPTLSPDLPPHKVHLMLRTQARSIVKFIAAREKVAEAR